MAAMYSKVKHAAVVGILNMGKSVSNIVKSLKVNRQFVYYTKKHFDQTGSVEDRPRSGWKKSMRIRGEGPEPDPTEKSQAVIQPED